MGSAFLIGLIAWLIPQCFDNMPPMYFIGITLIGLSIFLYRIFRILRVVYFGNLANAKILDIRPTMKPSWRVVQYEFKNGNEVYVSTRDLLLEETDNLLIVYNPNHPDEHFVTICSRK